MCMPIVVVLQSVYRCSDRQLTNNPTMHHSNSPGSSGSWQRMHLHFCKDHLTGQRQNKSCLSNSFVLLIAQLVKEHHMRDEVRDEDGSQDKSSIIQSVELIRIFTYFSLRQSSPCLDEHVSGIRIRSISEFIYYISTWNFTYILTHSNLGVLLGIH